MREYEYINPEDYDNEEAFGDDFETFEEINQHNSNLFNSYNTLYFCQGAYKIMKISDLKISNSASSCSFIIKRSEIDIEKYPSLLEIYELFDNSFLLEFLISVLAEGIINIESCNKVINLNDNDQCIMANAIFSCNQHYMSIEDIIESDNQVTEVIPMGSTQVMRSHQIFYSVTQATKYAIVKYDVISGSELEFTSYKVDWKTVYDAYINPYIELMIAMALKIDVDSINQYKDYMQFNIQFAIERCASAFYIEIYLLPKSILNRDIMYNETNGRQIALSLTDKEISTDEFRICMGTQNLALLPIDINPYHTIVNGKEYVISNEISSKNSIIKNKYILNYRQYTELDLANVVYITELEEFQSFPFKIIEGIDIDKLSNIKDPKKQDNFSINNSKSIDAIVQYFGFISPITDDIITLEYTDISTILGTIILNIKEPIAANSYIYSIKENLKTGATFLPKAFYENLCKKYNIENIDTIMLYPIRALPVYREYIVIAIDNHSKNIETHSSIISKNETNNPKKSGLIKSLFSKFGK